MVGGISLGNLSNVNTISTNQTIFVQKQNIEANPLFAFNQAVDEKALTLKAKAEAIDAFFKADNMPLEGLGMKMVEEAEKNNLDWRILPAIAFRESTGGIYACKKATHSFMGWGSCKIDFDSDEEAIEIVAWNLGGNNPNTDQYYAGKTTYEILRKYNSYIKNYPAQVMNIMENIGPAELSIQADQKAEV